MLRIQKRVQVLALLMLVALVPSLLIVCDDHPALDGAWKTVLLGILALKDRFLATGGWWSFWNFYVPLSICVGLIIPAIVKDSCLTRVLFFLGFFLWFICGASVVWVWK